MMSVITTPYHWECPICHNASEEQKCPDCLVLGLLRKTTADCELCGGLEAAAGDAAVLHLCEPCFENIA